MTTLTPHPLPVRLPTRLVASTPTVAVAVAVLVAAVVAGLLVATRTTAGAGDVPGRACTTGGDRLVVVSAGGAPCP